MPKNRSRVYHVSQGDPCTQCGKASRFHISAANAANRKERGKKRKRSPESQERRNKRKRSPESQERRRKLNKTSRRRGETIGWAKTPKLNLEVDRAWANEHVELMRHANKIVERFSDVSGVSRGALLWAIKAQMTGETELHIKTVFDVSSFSLRQKGVIVR